ncbi:unnamed protein product [Vitrella brassicaformis CCMP3155]|uniref:Uncharacterized protein n=1 Tax=Vitrella brassicaformis (strain CCMP3155) TaxID=1169540 RepID=A0A0G4H0W2_VITBC|nr:unnamed protein product [Vitrella brassicaformis CCMP3155]|eukprot:CEM36978.1 unnamed protein product [Vitrella brassicaformis CCMP3155]
MFVFTTPQNHQLGECSRLLFFLGVRTVLPGLPKSALNLPKSGNLSLPKSAQGTADTARASPDDENTQLLPADIHRQSFVANDASPLLMP